MSAFETPPPTLTAAEIETLAEDLFGMKGKARLLNSERDQNARIDADGTSYVLKIANAGEDPAQIALQNATLQHLALQGTSGVPHVIQALDGSLV
ncbi:MAG: aminotransferase, partial [Cypionkella sp.]